MNAGERLGHLAPVRVFDANEQDLPHEFTQMIGS
jgi:hypothetical protein